MSFEIGLVYSPYFSIQAKKYGKYLLQTAMIQLQYRQLDTGHGKIS